MKTKGTYHIGLDGLDRPVLYHSPTKLGAAITSMSKRTGFLGRALNAAVNPRLSEVGTIPTDAKTGRMDTWAAKGMIEKHQDHLQSLPFSTKAKNFGKAALGYGAATGCLALGAATGAALAIMPGAPVALGAAGAALGAGMSMPAYAIANSTKNSIQRSNNQNGVKAQSLMGTKIGVTLPNDSAARSVALDDTVVKKVGVQGKVVNQPYFNPSSAQENNKGVDHGSPNREFDSSGMIISRNEFHWDSQPPPKQSREENIAELMGQGMSEDEISRRVALADPEICEILGTKPATFGPDVDTTELLSKVANRAADRDPENEVAMHKALRENNDKVYQEINTIKHEQFDQEASRPSVA